MHGTINRLDYAAEGTILGAPVWQKYRYQAPVILLVTAAAQYITSLLTFNSPAPPSNVMNSMLLTLGASLAGLLWYRKMRSYPGAKRLAFVISSMGLSWSIMLVGVTVARIPYSVWQLSIGFSCVLALTLGAAVMARRNNPDVFLVIPSLRVKSALAELPGLPHRICHTKEDVLDGVGPIVADLHADLPSTMEQAIVEATLQGRSVYHIKQVSEALTGRVQIDHLSENALGTLAPDQSYAFLRSVAERLIAGLGLLLLSPILVAVSFAIRMDSKGPALFLQDRVGQGGRLFTIYKFRTMAVADGAPSRETDITLDNDPRVTRLGRFLRKSRIDELPQLINVLRGEMSFVGPRPETMRLSKWYAESIDFYNYRHVVLPGITGWAQINQGHVASTEDVFRKLQYDLYYVKNFSFWLDFIILLKTIRVMVFKLGAK